MPAYLEITELPEANVLGLQYRFHVTARDATGAVDTAYTGTVTFTSSDAIATLPAPYTFVGGDAGVAWFQLRLNTAGAQTVTVAGTGGVLGVSARLTVAVAPPGFGFDDEGLVAYGDVVHSTDASLRSVLLISTREVQVTVSNYVQDDSPYYAGDALNPATWDLQRLDTLEFLHIVSVRQTGTYSYIIQTYEEFGGIDVQHRLHTDLLLDLAGNVIEAPTYLDFAGTTDEDKDSLDDLLLKKRASLQDYANVQTGGEYFAGTLQIDAAGDYKLETGAALVKKLILRRLVSRKRDFFHLPDYGLGLRVKEPLPASDLGKLKTAIEQQCLREPEVASCAASLTMASNGVLTVTVRAQTKLGEAINVNGLKLTDTGLTL